MDNKTAKAILTAACEAKAAAYAAAAAKDINNVMTSATSLKARPTAATIEAEVARKRDALEAAINA